jgi:hypothetical protein
MRTDIAVVLLSVLGLRSCGKDEPLPSDTPPTAPAPAAKTAASVHTPKQVAIGLEELALPAGWMSGKNRPASVIKLGAGREGCKDGSGNERSGCTRMTFGTGQDWAGVLWWPIACGETGTAEAWSLAKSGGCGVDAERAPQLKQPRLTFWVRGERGGEEIELRIGTTDLAPSPGRSTGTLELAALWQQQQIDLEALELTGATALFAWIAKDSDNPKGAVFYLSDVRFEGLR